MTSILNRLLFAFLLFGTVFVFATESNQTKPSEQTIVASYEELPLKLYKNQLFAVKVRVLAGIEGDNTIGFVATGESGVRPLSKDAKFELQKDGSFELTLLYKVIADKVTTPSLSINFAGGKEKDASTLDGKEYAVSPLPDSSNFCGIIAQNLKLTNQKIDKYDNANNIIAIELKGRLADLEDFKLKNIAQQGANSLKSGKLESTLFYYFVIPSTQDIIEFQYFDSDKDQFKTITTKLDLANIEEKVSTQTELSPKSNDKMLYVFIVVTIIATVLYAIYYFRRERIFLILIFVVIGAGFLFLFIPNEQARLKKDCSVYLLPTESSTPFFKAEEEIKVEKIKEADGFVKIELEDHKIGWTRADCVHKN